MKMDTSFSILMPCTASADHNGIMYAPMPPRRLRSLQSVNLRKGEQESPHRMFASSEDMLELASFNQTSLLNLARLHAQLRERAAEREEGVRTKVLVV